jgi:hypothetical protein
MRGEYLIYGVETFTTMPETSSSYSLLLEEWNNDRPQENQSKREQPMRVFSRTWPARQSVTDSAPEWGVAGPGAYAYTDDRGALHAHLYDEQVDVALESGVGSILALSANYLYKVLN